MSTSTPGQGIQHIFVLVMENRSFDHMLGFSGITGTDAVSGQPTKIQGLDGTESNSYQGTPYPVSQPADYSMPVDPGHEFPDVVTQLAGPGATYPSGGAYPSIVDSGFVASYVQAGGQANPGEIMKCYAPDQLPVLNALAQEFAVCDNWFSSMPGPTWPNRFFVNAASSGGLDHSPDVEQMLKWETVDGFGFQNGSLFNKNLWWRIYADGELCISQALKGVLAADITAYKHFASDVASAGYPVQYTFIEPNYGDMISGTYKGGTSQHPLDDVRNGEAFIKATYEALRNSPIWESSMLIITWDEHGGFYDHATPPAAPAPGDKPVMSSVNQYGFTFQQYGARVPAVIISPWIARNVIDHRLYDHASIPATVEARFGLSPMTQRDAQANNVLALASLASPRTDCPTTLPSPATSLAMAASAPVAKVPDAHEPVNQGNLPGFVHLAVRSDLELSAPEQRPAILARAQGLQTRGEAYQYIQEVQQKVRAHREGTPRQLDPARRAQG